MPFIFIDHGSTINRPYQAVKKPNVKAVNEGTASSVVHEHDTPPIQSKQQNQQGVKQYQSQTSRKRVKRADEIMTTPVEILEIEQHSPADAWERMQQRNIRHLPVTQNKKLMAMVCERDLLLYVMKNGHLPQKLNPIMINQVHAALPETDIHQLAYLMFDEHIGSLPIVDQEQSVIGIVTRYDILNVMSAYGPMEYWA